MRKKLKFDDGSALHVSQPGEDADTQFDVFPSGDKGHKTGSACPCSPRKGRREHVKVDGSTMRTFTHKEL